DDTFVAFAARDPKCRARRLGAGLCGRERGACGLQPIVGLLNFQPDLLRDFFFSQHELALRRARLGDARGVRAAVEQSPGEYERSDAEVVAVARAVLLALRAGVESQRQRRPLALPRNAHLLLARALQLLELCD